MGVTMVCVAVVASGELVVRIGTIAMDVVDVVNVGACIGFYRANRVCNLDLGHL